MLANAVKLEEISIPPKSEFFDHGNMLQTGPVWRDTHDIQY